ncbi:MAG: Mlo family-domain-containing protein [Monoraphidium minutum]|nr:MAG: Mlo family-domain-containing protein [Monoraphidium minutum]
MADIAETPGWRTGLLFLLFAVISVFLEEGTHWLEHKWSSRRGTSRSNGLITMLTFIKQELFLLGLISMLLTAVQDSMLKICIPDAVARYGLHWTPDPLEEVTKSKASAYSSSYMKDEASKGRHLLAGAPKSDYNACSTGNQPLFSAYMIYQVHIPIFLFALTVVHILIFLFAVVHVLYVFGTLMVCLVQIRQWRHWEEEAPAADAFLRISNQPTTPHTPNTPRGGGGAHPGVTLRRARRSAKALWTKIGTSRFSHAWHMAVAVVTTDLFFSPVTRAVYYSLRLMFIDRLGLDYSFDFAAFIERSIEEHVPYLMKLNAVMMCLAAALLSFPFPAYMPYWLFGLSVVVELLLAGKLASVTTLAAGQALVMYSEDFKGNQFSRSEAGDDMNVTARGGKDLLEIYIDSQQQKPPPGGAPAEPPLVRVSASAGAAPPAAAAPQTPGEAAAAAAAGVRAARMPAAAAAAAPESAAEATRRQSKELESRLEHRLGAPPPPAPEPMPKLRPLRTAAGAAAAAPPPDARAVTRAIERCTSLQELEDYVAAHGATFNQIHVSLALLQLHRIAERAAAAAGGGAADNSAGPVGEAAERVSDEEDYAAWQRQQPPGAAPGGLARQDSQSVWDAMQEEADAGRGGRYAADQNGGAATAAAAKGGPPPPLLVPRSPSASVASFSSQSRRQQRVMDRVAALPADPSKLFWFGRPRLLLWLFQFVFYSNAFLMTLAFFAFWQKHVNDWMYEGVGVMPTVLLICGSVLLAIHSALRVLPQFALIEPIGHHCPQAVLRRALKEGGLQPEEAEALAAELGIELPEDEKKKRRRGRKDAKGFKRTLQRILNIKPKPHHGGGDDGALVAPAAAAHSGGHGGGGHGRRRSHEAERNRRRSLEDIKTASMGQLLGMLPPAGADAGGAASAAAAPAADTGPVAAGSAFAAWQASVAAAAAAAPGGAPPAAGAGGGGGEGLPRARSTPNLLARPSAPSAGGGGGGGDTSSNVELAGEMLRALILKQARTGQPLTPRTASMARGPSQHNA